MKTYKVGARGKELILRVPSFVAAQLGLEKGDKVTWELDGDRAVMRKA